MIRTKLSWTVANIEKMYDKKETLSFDHPIQRKSEIWSEQQKSLLIHSMLANYPIPNIYVLREDSKETDKSGKPVFNFSVLDGKQRLTSTLSYLWGEFELSENIPPVTIEDEEYELAGKYFADLDKAVQYEIEHYKFEIIAFEQCSNREVEEIFLRLNNGSALSKAQIAKAKAGVEVAVFLNEMLDSKFIKEICFFTKQQVAKSEDQRCILQAMMLFDRNYIPNYEFKDFSEQEIAKYAESLNGNYTERQADVVRSSIEYLGNAFQEKNKNMKKISVPMILYMADYAQDKEISPRQFCKWYEYFTTKDRAAYEDFKYFGNSGSINMQKINGRLAVMAESFCQFNKIDIPEELTDIVRATKELLKERDALLAQAENSRTDDALGSVVPGQNSHDAEETGSNPLIAEMGQPTEESETENVASFVAEELESDTSDTLEQEETEIPESLISEKEESKISTNKSLIPDQKETAILEELETSETYNAEYAEEETATEDNLQNAE